MKKRTNVTSKNPIIIDLINLFSRLKLRVGFFRFVVELLILWDQRKNLRDSLLKHKF